MSRTNLEVEPISRTHYLFGKKVHEHTKRNENNKVAVVDSVDGNMNNNNMIAELQFIYLDSDLCITMIGGDNGILNVYTKNAEWRESRKNDVCTSILLCTFFFFYFGCLFFFLFSLFSFLLLQYIHIYTTYFCIHMHSLD